MTDDANTQASDGAEECQQCAKAAIEEPRQRIGGVIALRGTCPKCRKRRRIMRSEWTWLRR